MRVNDPTTTEGFSFFMRRARGRLVMVNFASRALITFCAWRVYHFTMPLTYNVLLTYHWNGRLSIGGNLWALTNTENLAVWLTSASCNSPDYDWVRFVLLFIARGLSFGPAPRRSDDASFESALAGLYRCLRFEIWWSSIDADWWR